MLCRVRSRIATQPQVPIHVHPFEVHRIDRVFLALKPVTWNFGKDNLAETILPSERLPIWNERGRRGTKVSPNQSSSLGDRIGLDSDFVFEVCVARCDIVVWLLEAPARFIEHPSVIIATQSAC